MEKLEIDSGILTYDKDTHQVRADPRKGKITEQGEKKFEWFTENQKDPLFELYLFENDAKFKQVQGASSGRSFEDKYFFWFQTQDRTKDVELAQKINNMINKSEQPVEQENNQIIMRQLQQDCMGSLMIERKSPTLEKILKNSLGNLTDEFLPQNQGLQENIRSMEFLQAVKTLDALIWSEEFKSICISFGIYDELIFQQSKDRILKSH